MSDEDFKKLQSTFPWTTQIMHAPVGGLVRMVDRFGNEVPLFAMTDLLQMLTRKLDKEPTA